MVWQISSLSDGRKGIVMKFVILLFPASAEELNVKFQVRPMVAKAL
jgi:hypothetical protein